MRSKIHVHFFGDGAEKLEMWELQKAIAEYGLGDLVQDIGGVIGGAVTGGWVGGGAAAAATAWNRLGGGVKAAKLDRRDVNLGGWDTPRPSQLSSYAIVEFQAYTEDPIKVSESFGLVDPKAEILDLGSSADRHGDDNQWWYRFHVPLAILSPGVYRFAFGSGDDGVQDATVGCVLELNVNPAPPQQSIDDKYQDLARNGVRLGAPVGPEESAVAGGRFRRYESGVIYSSRGRGPRCIYGAIFEKWKELGRETGLLGFPITDEHGTPDGIGRYNNFQFGTILWTPQLGAHEVHGGIREEYARQTWEQGPLGYPVTDEAPGSRPGSRVSRFQHGHIEWTPETGIAVVRS